MKMINIDISDVCRICLKDSDLYSDIFNEKFVDESLLVEVVNDILQLDVELDDGLPRYLCSECYNQVSDFELFKRSAHEGRAVLRCAKQSLLGEDPIIKEEKEDEENECERGFVGVQREIDYQPANMHSEEIIIPDVCQATSKNEKFIEKEKDFNSSSTNEITDNAMIDYQPANMHSEEIIIPDVCQDMSSYSLSKEDLLSEGQASENASDAGEECLFESEEQQKVTAAALRKKPHPIENKFHCDFCEVIYDDKEKLKQHMMTAHEEADREKSGPCAKNNATGSDDKIITSKQNKKKRKRGAKSDNNHLLTCFDCGKAFKQKEDLLVHTSIHTEVRPFQCDICPKAFPRLGHLKRHKRVHTGERPFQCDTCLKRFGEKSVLKQHQQLVHSVKGEGSPSFKCDICEKSFAHRVYLKKHKLTHNKDRPFICSYCGKQFPNKRNLKEHEMIHSGDQPFKCNECNKRFTLNSNLTRHKRACHAQDVDGGQVRRFQCQECDKCFNYSKNLAEHMNVHTGLRPFKCTSCKMSFNYSASLRAHETTHSQEKPHKCELCGIGFARKDKLRRHEKVHKGEPAFICDECGKTFLQSSNLKRHKKVHHGEGL